MILEDVKESGGMLEDVKDSGGILRDVYHSEEYNKSFVNIKETKSLIDQMNSSEVDRMSFSFKNNFATLYKGLIQACLDDGSSVSGINSLDFFSEDYKETPDKQIIGPMGRHTVTGSGTVFYVLYDPISESETLIKNKWSNYEPNYGMNLIAEDSLQNHNKKITLCKPQFINNSNTIKNNNKFIY